MKTYVHLWYFTEFFLEWKIFRAKAVEKIEKHILFSVFFPRKACQLWDNVEKPSRARHATDNA
jgi:hypothetical protein